MRDSSSRQRQAGFSLVEMLAVLGLAGIFMMFATAMVGSREDVTADRVARDVAAQVKAARMRAIARQEPTTITVPLDGKSYLLTPAGISYRMPEASPFVVSGPGAVSFTFDQRGALTVPSAITLSVASKGWIVPISITPVGQVSVGAGAKS